MDDLTIIDFTPTPDGRFANVAHLTLGRARIHLGPDKLGWSDGW